MAERQAGSIFDALKSEHESPLAEQPIPKQREYVVTLEELTDLDALASEEKNLLTQEGQDPSCAFHHRAFAEEP